MADLEEYVSVVYRGEFKKLEKSVYSNFDHQLDKGIIHELIEGNCFSDHTARNFCGYVYFENGKFKKVIWRHNQIVDVIEDSDIEKLIESVNERLGRR